MKNIVSIVALLASVSSFACPNLDGKYLCPDKDGKMEEMEVRFADNAYNVTTAGKTETYKIGDWQPFEVPVPEEMAELGIEISARVKAECSEEVASIFISIEMPEVMDEAIETKLDMKATEKGLSMSYTIKDQSFVKECTKQ